MTDPLGTDPDDRDPDEVDLSRRSHMPAISPWMLIGVIALLGVMVYVISAMR